MIGCEDCRQTLPWEKFFRSEFRCGHFVCLGCQESAHRKRPQMPWCTVCELPARGGLVATHPATDGIQSNGHSPLPLSLPYRSHCARHPNNPLTLICLNADCKEKRGLCTLCLGSVHKECRPNEVVEATVLHPKLRFQTPIFPPSLDTVRLKAVLATELHRLGQLMDSMIDEFDALVRREYTFIQKMSGDLNFFTSQVDALAIKVLAADHVTARLRHEEAVAELVSDVDGVFMGEFWTCFRKTATDFWVQELKLVSRLRSEYVDKNRLLLSHLCRYDYFILTRLVLSSFELMCPVSLEGTVQQMTECLSPRNNPLELKIIESFTHDEAMAVKNEIWLALLQAPKANFEGIRVFLVGILQERFPGKRLDVKFRFVTSETDRSVAKYRAYLRFEYNEFEVSVGVH